MHLSPQAIENQVAQHGAPLLLLSTQTIRSQYRLLRSALPGVDLHYALKPLPHPAVVAALDEEGAFFDLCSGGEVDLISARGIAAERCIHTHPIKRDSDIQHALKAGITTFVFDNPDELPKFLPYKDQVQLLLRLSFRSAEAVVDLSRKFGVEPQEAMPLILKAKELGLCMQGLCFHVGSQNINPAKYLEAIGFCRQLFSLAALEGIILRTLDIGGGFPVQYLEPVVDIQEYCAPIVKALEADFPGVRIIAEPGRFISGPAMVQISSIMGKAERQGVMWYYLDDGMYGSWSGKMYDHADYPFTPLCQLRGEERPQRLSVVAGPTCDSIDVVHENMMLPELEIGELVVSEVMGAYTWASATEFNFFPKTQIIEVD